MWTNFYAKIEFSDNAHNLHVHKYIYKYDTHIASLDFHCLQHAELVCSFFSDAMKDEVRQAWADAHHQKCLCGQLIALKTA